MAEGESTLGVFLCAAEWGFYFHLVFLDPYSLASSCWATTERNNQLGHSNAAERVCFVLYQGGLSLIPEKDKELVFRFSSC